MGKLNPSSSQPKVNRPLELQEMFGYLKEESIYLTALSLNSRWSGREGKAI